MTMAKKKKEEGKEIRSVAIKPVIAKVNFTCSKCNATKQVPYPEMAPYMELSTYECECGEVFNFAPPHKIGALIRRYD
jgi:hypothetical protein